MKLVHVKLPDDPKFCVEWRMV